MKQEKEKVEEEVEKEEVEGGKTWQGRGKWSTTCVMSNECAHNSLKMLRVKLDLCKINQISETKIETLRRR